MCTPNIKDCFEHEIFTSPFFPNFSHFLKKPHPALCFQSKPKSKKTNLNHLILGIGGNKGRVIHTFHQLFLKLKNHKKIYSIHTSLIYKNPPFGYIHQPYFYNSIISPKTSMNLTECFRLIFYLERYFKRPRKRNFKNEPRTLDIDLLFFNDLVLRLPHLQLPHPHLAHRDSVIIPLMLLAMKES